jgi:alpha-D-xyloside xylohydrolase
MPDAAVFKRWLAFGLMSSHSRLHGSTSYRVPWLFDDGSEEPGQSAVEVTRRFTRLKLSLMPYLYQVGLEAHRRGIPFMRPMQLEFAGDPAVDYLDRQYLLGPDLLVAPVFSESGDVQYYLPAGTWTNHLTGEVAVGPVWRRETHAFDSIPLWVRGGAVLATGSRDDRPDYDYTEGTLVTVYPGETSSPRTVEVTNPLDGGRVVFVVTLSGGDTVVTSDSDAPFRARLAGHDAVDAVGRTATLR